MKLSKTLTATDLTKVKFHEITDWLEHHHSFLAVSYFGDVREGYEIHRPGTGVRLAELEAASDETPNA